MNLLVSHLSSIIHNSVHTQTLDAQGSFLEIVLLFPDKNDHEDHNHDDEKEKDDCY